MTEQRYQQLLAKIDAKAEELARLHGAHISCHKGCHSCCLPGLRMFPVEAEHIRTLLLARPDRAAAALANETLDPHQGTRCAFLDAKGACLIYEARPVVCRTHGFPLEFKVDEDAKSRDVCPLNFDGQDLNSLPPAGVLNLDLINTLLTLINQDASGASAAERIPLQPSFLLQHKDDSHEH